MAGQKFAREPHRYSGRTAMLAHVSVHEAGTPADTDSALAFSMEGFPGAPPPALVPYYWAPGWNSAQALNKFQEEIAGPLRGGDPGVRLIEPGTGNRRPDFGVAPMRVEHRPGEWLVVPLHHIFGSEELSALAPAVARLAPRPYLALNAADAAVLGLEPGALAQLVLAGTRHRLAVRIDATLPPGAAGVPAGLPDLQGLALPAYGTISRVEPA
jgi:NADH-quinone oxidoreductase subunit G